MKKFDERRKRSFRKQKVLEANQQSLSNSQHFSVPATLKSSD